MLQRFHEGDDIRSDAGRTWRVLATKNGGMGIIYVVREGHSGQVYALKALQERFRSDTKAKDLFFREALTWVRLEKHRNIVQAILVDRVAADPYILIEYIPHDKFGRCSLRDWLRENPLNVSEALRVAIDCCNALIHAQQKVSSLVHRDLKPDNILLTPTVAKVTDFGLVQATQEVMQERAGQEGLLARAARALRSTRTARAAPDIQDRPPFSKSRHPGTPPYMSPEQCSGMELDTRSDVYSMGVTLYEMLLGHCPFPAFSAEELLEFQSTEEPKPLCDDGLGRDIPKELDDIVLKCLNYAPENRYKNFAELRNALDDVYLKQTGRRAHPIGAEILENWEVANQAVSFKQLGLSNEARNKRKVAEERRAAFWKGFGPILQGELGFINVNPNPQHAAQIVKDFKIENSSVTTIDHAKAALYLIRNFDEKRAAAILAGLASFGAASQVLEALARIESFLVAIGEAQLKDKEIEKAATILCAFLAIIPLETAVSFYSMASTRIKIRIEVQIGMIDPRALDAIRNTWDAKEAIQPALHVTIRALDLEKFLVFLARIGFRVNPTGHGTYSDYSEHVSLHLEYGGRSAGELKSVYIDSHFWPKSKIKSTDVNGVKMRKQRMDGDGTPKWRIAVQPVVVMISHDAPIPATVLASLQSYSDQLPSDPEAHEAYTDYLQQTRESSETPPVKSRGQG